MKKIPQRNYIILVVLLLVTVLLTLLLSNIYTNKEKLTSSFYQYSNKITPESFDEFVLENEYIIMYIADKYDLTFEKIENRLQNKIDELNLKHNFIYLDKSYINNKFIKKLKSYEINININKLPVVVIMAEKKVIKNISIDLNTNVDTLIDNEVFE